jgi:hypothetical protein
VTNNNKDRTIEILRAWDKPKTIIPLWFVDDAVKRLCSVYAPLALCLQIGFDFIRRDKIEFTHVWQLDDDIYIESPDAIETFAAWDVDIIGGSYPREFPEGIHLTAKFIFPDGSYKMIPAVYAPLMEPTVIGGGCMFMSRKLIMDPRVHVYPVFHYQAATDFGFCLHLRDLGYITWLDGIVRMAHNVHPTGRGEKPWTHEGKGIEWKYEK